MSFDVVRYLTSTLCEPSWRSCAPMSLNKPFLEVSHPPSSGRGRTKSTNSFQYPETKFPLCPPFFKYLHLKFCPVQKFLEIFGTHPSPPPLNAFSFVL